MVFDLVPKDEPEAIEIHDRNCILIIDSDQRHLVRLADSFSSQGFKVLSHTKGQYGFETAKKSQPDCILVDIDLIDTSGMDLCRAIVDSPNTCGIPVIVMGKATCYQTVQEARAAGCQFFVCKPVDPKALLMLVNESIAEARSWICD